MIDQTIQWGDGYAWAWEHLPNEDGEDPMSTLDDLGFEPEGDYEMELQENCTVRIFIPVSDKAKVFFKLTGRMGIVG